MVAFLDGRQPVEVSDDTRLELLSLRFEQLELTLPARALTPGPGLVPESRGEPRPFGTHHGCCRADEQGDHQPAHVLILPARIGCQI